jgi:hypothetical protein
LAGAGNWPFWNLAGAGAVNFINPSNGPVLNDYLLRIRWNIVIVKTIRGYKNKGPLLKVGTPDIILS